MAKKQDLRALLSRQLGPDVADSLIKRVTRMAKQGASADKIERAFMTDLARYIEKRVGNLVGTSVNALDGVKILVVVQPSPRVRSKK